MAVQLSAISEVVRLSSELQLQRNHHHAMSSLMQVDISGEKILSGCGICAAMREVRFAYLCLTPAYD